GCDPSLGRLSIVVTFLAPTAETGVIHERVACPSIWTVQAPHWAMPQPNLVPFRPSASRSTHKSGIRSGTSTASVLPLTFSEYFIVHCLRVPWPRRANAWIVDNY